MVTGQTPKTLEWNKTSVKVVIIPVQNSTHHPRSTSYIADAVDVGYAVVVGSQAAGGGKDGQSAHHAPLAQTANVSYVVL